MMPLRRSPDISAAIVLAVLLGGCAGLPTARKANVSFSTVASSWPASTACLNSPTPSGIANDVLVGSTRTVILRDHRQQSYHQIDFAAATYP